MNSANYIIRLSILVSLGLTSAAPALASSADSSDPAKPSVAPATTTSAPATTQHRGWGRMGPPPGGDPFSVENRSRIPWFFTVGAYFPNGTVPVFSEGEEGTQNVSGNVGTDFSLGFRFPFQNGEGRVAIRGSEFNYGSSGGNFGFGDSRNCSITEFDVDVLGRIKGFYAGIGAAFMNATLSSDFGSVTDNNTEVALAYTVGYDITPRWFIEGRAHYTGVPFYSGESLSIGYRF